MAELSRRALRILQEFSIPLLAGVVSALAWANVDHASYEAVVHYSPFGHGNQLNLHFFANDILMAFFFGIAAKEITEACLPGGSLNPPSKAINPLLGTAGGVLGPIAVFFAWVAVTGDHSIINGWGIPTATDIAMAWLVARMAFGAGHPAVSFLLLLAVADDGIGLAIIAIFYPDPANPVQPVFLLAVAAAIGIAFIMRKRGVQSFWPYVVVPGALSWLGLFAAHLHPALALVPVIPFMPNMGYDEGLFAEENDGHRHQDTLNQFEHFFKAPVDFGLFIFGLANAGVVISSVGGATTAVLVALLVGKTLGIFSFSMIGARLGFRLPDGMTWRSLLVAGVTASLGLTVALFVAGVAYTNPTLQGAAKIGALLSAVGAPLALLAGRVLGVKARAPRRSPATAMDVGARTSVRPQRSYSTPAPALASIPPAE